MRPALDNRHEAAIVWILIVGLSLGLIVKKGEEVTWQEWPEGKVAILEGSLAVSPIHASPSLRSLCFSVLVHSFFVSCRLLHLICETALWCSGYLPFYGIFLGLKESSVSVALKLVSKRWQTQDCFSPQPRAIRQGSCW